MEQVLFNNNNIKCDQNLMKVVPVMKESSDRYMNINYI